MIGPLSMNISTAIGARKPAAIDPNGFDPLAGDIAVPFLLPNFAHPIVPAASDETVKKSEGMLQDGEVGGAEKTTSDNVVQTEPLSLVNLKTPAQPDLVDPTGVAANSNITDPAKPASIVQPLDQMTGPGKLIDADKSGTSQLPGNNEIFAELRRRSIESRDVQNTPVRFQALKVDIGPMVSVSDPRVLLPVGTTKSVVDAGIVDLSYDAEPTSSENLIAQLKQADLGANDHELSQSKPNEPAKADFQENLTASFADNLVAAASKKNLNTIAETQTSKFTTAVFEQIEPRILGLAGLTQNGADKRILKMRLNPAELGGVEITLEKNSSGSISAHFQTESEKTRQILGESLVQLRISLENSGWQVGDLNISCNPSLSHGGDAHGGRSQSFGKAEQRAVLTTSSDGVLTNEGDKEDRLVNLRA